MTAHIVTWVVLVATPCPPPESDRYGLAVEELKTMECYRRELKARTFDNESEAKAFVANAPQDFRLRDFQIAGPR